jgi:hypothetical protein
MEFNAQARRRVDVWQQDIFTTAHWALDEAPSFRLVLLPMSSHSAFAFLLSFFSLTSLLGLGRLLRPARA